MKKGRMTMEKKKKIEKAFNRLQEAQESGYIVQAYLAQADLDELMYS